MTANEAALHDQVRAILDARRHAAAARLAARTQGATMADRPTITTEDGAELTEGAVAFNYYDMRWGTIRPGTIDEAGWFTFDHADGTTAVLNGARVSTYDPRMR